MLALPKDWEDTSLRAAGSLAPGPLWLVRLGGPVVGLMHASKLRSASGSPDACMQPVWDVRSSLLPAPPPPPAL